MKVVLNSSMKHEMGGEGTLTKERLEEDKILFFC